MYEVREGHVYHVKHHLQLLVDLLKPLVHSHLVPNIVDIGYLGPAKHLAVQLATCASPIRDTTGPLLQDALVPLVL